MEKKDNDFKKVNEELKIYEKKISNADKNILLVEENLEINENQYKNKINDVTHEYSQIDLINLKLKAEYDLIKRELDEVIIKTKDKYKESLNKILDAQNTLDEMKGKYNDLQKLYENMMNPDKLVPINKRNAGKRMSTKKLRLNRRFSTLDNKKKADNNNQKVVDNNQKKPKEIITDNLLKTISEINNITNSTSPTIPKKDKNNKNNLKKNSIQRKSIINKNE